MTDNVIPAVEARHALASTPAHQNSDSNNNNNSNSAVVTDQLSVSGTNQGVCDDEQMATSASLPAAPPALHTYPTLAQLMQRAQDALAGVFSDTEMVLAEVTSIKVKSSVIQVELSDFASATRHLTAKMPATIFNRGIIKTFEAQANTAFKPGLKVLVTLELSYHAVYGLSGVIKHIDHRYTLGDLALLKTHIKSQLVAQGLFELNRGLVTPVDFFHIGIITPQRAAGLDDFKQKLSDIPQTVCHTSYMSCVFQSDKAGPAITGCIASLLDNYYYADEEDSALPRLDAIVILRGGGASADMSYLNNQQIASAICQSPIPVLVGIGHATDVCVLDEVANASFPTPSLVASFIRERISERAYGLQRLFAEITSNMTLRVNRQSALFASHWDKLSGEFAGRVHAIDKEARGAQFAIVHGTTAHFNQLSRMIDEYGLTTLQACERQFTQQREAIHQEYAQITVLAEQQLTRVQQDVELAYRLCDTAKTNAIGFQQKTQAMAAQGRRQTKLIYGLSGVIIIIVVIAVFMAVTLWGGAS